jgi:signal transduction histidine kinase
LWRGTASARELCSLLARFLGSDAAQEAFRAYAAQRRLRWPGALPADAELVHFVEVQLAGAIGASSARVMVASVAKEEALTLTEVRAVLDEASQVVVTSHRLEQKSRELEQASGELRAANERLTELDRLKDEFVATVTHELRTPLTSIRAFSQILHDNPDVPPEQRAAFLAIITREAERLTRLINQVLDLAKLEAGQVEWRISTVDVRFAAGEAIAAASGLFRERAMQIELDAPESLPPARADLDRVIQVMLNLLSNAAKFCEAGHGSVRVALARDDEWLRVEVHDNGPGIEPREQQRVFEKFHQAGDALTGKAQGTGLGLHISRRIVEHLGGRIWVTSWPGGGSCFGFTLPRAAGDALERAA